jgi:hypothetical protein
VWEKILFFIDPFQAVVRKKYGLAIIVSSVVKETNATWSLTDPSEVERGYDI